MSRQKRRVAPYTFRSKDKISQTIRLLPSPITGSRVTPVTARGTDHPRRLVSSLVVQGRQWKDRFVFDRFLEVNLITLLKKKKKKDMSAKPVHTGKPKRMETYLEWSGGE